MYKKQKTIALLLTIILGITSFPVMALSSDSLSQIRNEQTENQNNESSENSLLNNKNNEEKAEKSYKISDEDDSEQITLKVDKTTIDEINIGNEYFEEPFITAEIPLEEDMQSEYYSVDDNIIIDDSIYGQWLKLNTNDEWEPIDTEIDYEYEEGSYCFELIGDNLSAVEGYEFLQDDYTDISLETIPLSYNIDEDSSLKGYYKNNEDGTVSFKVYSEIYRLSESDLSLLEEQNPLADNIYYKISGNTLYLRTGSSSGYTKQTSNYTNEKWCWNSSITTIVIENKIKPSYGICFKGLVNLTDIQNLSNLDTSLIRDMSYMFQDCHSLKNIDGTLLKGRSGMLATTSCMFQRCYSLESINLSNLNSSAIKSAAYMFDMSEDSNNSDTKGRTSSLQSVTIKGFGKTTVFTSMFDHCIALTNVTASDISTASAVGMDSMFNECESLTSIDISNWNMAKVTSANNLFHNCYKLTSITGLESRNVSKLARINYGFANCTSLTSLSFSGWNTSSLQSMSHTFEGCSNLKTINFGSNFTVNNVTDLSYAFADCSNLETLDLSKWDTSNVDGDGREGTLMNCTGLQELKTQASGRSDFTLPIKMMEKDVRDGMVYSKMPNAKTLVPFSLDYLLDTTETMISMSKTVDDNTQKELDNAEAIPTYNFAVYSEDGTLVLDNIQNDAKGRINIETKDLPLGRYYVQEIPGTDSSINYDTSKFYFTKEKVSEEIKGTEVTVGDKVYDTISSDIITKYKLVVSAYNVSAVDSSGKTVMTLKSYCANENKNTAYGTLGTAYINPTTAQINEVRGETYSGPYEGEDFANALKCIMYFETDNKQSEIWNLFKGNTVDCASRYNEIPSDFQYAIITSPQTNMQPQLVSLLTSHQTINESETTVGTKESVQVTVENPNSVFRNFKETKVNTEKGKLIVTKTVNFLGNGNADADRLFKFNVTYTSDTRTTTETFFLKHGESKVFDNLDVGSYYKVTEEDYSSDGYNTTSSNTEGTIPSGTTGVTASFTNTQRNLAKFGASITVSKVTAGDAGDSSKYFDFQFNLIDENENPVSETYDISSLTENEDVSKSTLTFVNGKATVKLKNGSSISMSFPDGYSCSIEELNADDYSTSIQSNHIYTNNTSEVKTITDSKQVDINLASEEKTFLTYTNTKQTSFKVKKTVTNVENSITDFTFELKDKDNNPIKNAVYINSSDNTKNLFTDDNGKFTLKNSETATFYNIPVGTVINIYEVPTTGFTQVLPANNEGYTNKTLSDTIETFEFENEYSSGSIKIYKMDEKNNPVKDVTFKLQSVNDKDLIKELSTDDKGVVLFEDLIPGEYTVTELKTENGKQLLAEPINVTLPLIVSKKEAENLGLDTTNGTFNDTTQMWTLYDITITVTNNSELEMPSTGGNGTWVYGYFGLSAIICAVGYMTLFHKKETK